MKTSYNGSWEAVCVGSSSSLFWAAGLSLHPLLSRNVEFLFEVSLRGAGDFASTEATAALYVGDSHQLWTGFKKCGQQRWGRPQAIHPPACLRQFLVGNSGEAAKRKDVFPRGVFCFFQESFLGGFFMAPHSIIRESQQHKSWKEMKAFSVIYDDVPFGKQNNSLIERWSSLQHNICISLDLVSDKWEGWQHLTEAENSNSCTSALV